MKNFLLVVKSALSFATKTKLHGQKKIWCFVFSFFVVPFAQSASFDQGEKNHKLTSYFPKENLALFIAQHLDLATFLHSMNPRRVKGQRTFQQLGLVPTTVSDDKVEFLTKDWTYVIEVLRRTDRNRDGIEDVEICFTDLASRREYGGTYAARSAWLITRYSNTSYVVAIAYTADQTGCADFEQNKN